MSRSSSEGEANIDDANDKEDDGQDIDPRKSIQSSISETFNKSFNKNDILHDPSSTNGHSVRMNKEALDGSMKHAKYNTQTSGKSNKLGESIDSASKKMESYLKKAFQQVQHNLFTCSQNSLPYNDGLIKLYEDLLKYKNESVSNVRNKFKHDPNFEGIMEEYT